MGCATVLTSRTTLGGGGRRGPAARSRQWSPACRVGEARALVDQDGGDFSLMERTLPAGGPRLPPHRHTNCSEAYFALDGEVAVEVEGEELLLGPEQFVLVPRGTAHTFGNAGEREARMLVLHPPAMDAYFAELHALWARADAPTRDEERALMARFGMEPV